MSKEVISDVLAMTTEIVVTYVGNNTVPPGEVSILIGSVHAALRALGSPAPVAASETKPRGAVSIRKSLEHPDHIISMINGKPYAMLSRHLRGAGYTPQSYRRTFGLPADYPMTAPTYSEKRRALAKALGLGRQKVEPAPEQPAPEPKRARLKIKV